MGDILNTNAPLAVQASKRIAYGAHDRVIADERAAWARTERELTRLLVSEDAREGAVAFAEKRPPIWQGR